MAQRIQFVCSECGQSINAWSDGNPFYIDENGVKKYAYHPNHDELAKCVANDVPHYCLTCGKESKIDSRLDSKVCPECGSDKVVRAFSMEGVKCAKCKNGYFARNKDSVCIS